MIPKKKNNGLKGVENMINKKKPKKKKCKGVKK